jgi:hypothetical protein
MRKICAGAALAILSTLPVLADKSIKPAETGDEKVDLSGTVYAGKDAAAEVIGADPAGMDLIVVQVRLRPRGDTEIAVSRDDFLILSRRDGQRSQPLHPSQVAGKGTLVVSRSGGGGVGGVMNQQRGPIWGGMPGTGGRPTRVGGDDDATVSGLSQEQVSSEVKEGGGDGSLLSILKTKELPQGKTDKEISGLLYFLLDGRHKAKDLELVYEGTGRKLRLDFIR